MRRACYSESSWGQAMGGARGWDGLEARLGTVVAAKASIDEDSAPWRPDRLSLLSHLQGEERGL